MSLHHAVERAAAAERDLADALGHLADRHGAEHDVAQLARRQAGGAATRGASLASIAAATGAHLPAPAHDHASPGMLDTLRGKAGERLPASAAGDQLIDDLVDCYVAAQRAEMAWIVLDQGARAMRDSDLEALVGSAHADCEVTAKWLRTRIKVAAPQVLAVLAR